MNLWTLRRDMRYSPVRSTMSAERLGPKLLACTSSGRVAFVTVPQASHFSGGKTSKLPNRARPWGAAYRCGVSVAIEGRGEPVWSAPRGLSGPSRRALGARVPLRASPEGTTASRRTPLRLRRLIRRACRASEWHRVEVERGGRWRARWREGLRLVIETCVGELSPTLARRARVLAGP
jgi:hypothetical protein